MPVKVDISSQDYLRDPAAGIARLRTMGPVVEIGFPIVGKVWITTTQELAGRVLKTARPSRYENMAARSRDSDGGFPASSKPWPTTC